MVAANVNSKRPSMDKRPVASDEEFRRQCRVYLVSEFSLGSVLPVIQRTIFSDSVAVSKEEALYQEAFSV
jgi:hypothetical protein